MGTHVDGRGAPDKPEKSRDGKEVSSQGIWPEIPTWAGPVRSHHPAHDFLSDSLAFALWPGPWFQRPEINLPLKQADPPSSESARDLLSYPHLALSNLPVFLLSPP